ncbi:MAG: hypothetical protein C0396_01965 [Anaerolinea sp.]|nr:hypothetical protein [Anaerolinea sp.]
MLKTRSQHFNFGHEALPTIFHTQTSDFFEYLERDGLKFLKFWWNHVAERLDNDKLTPFEGMGFEVREVPEKKAKIVLVRFPHPTDFDEFHYAALVKTPDKRSPFVFVKFPSTRVLVLAHVPLSQSDTGTQIFEITPRGRYLPAGPGTPVNKEVFYKAVLKLIWKK